MTISPVSTAPTTQSVTALRAWAPSLVAISLALIVFGLTFRLEIAGAIRVWDDSTAYNHCYLVLPLVVIMLWARRGVITALRPWPMPAVLWLVPLLSGLWLIAAALDVLEADQLTMVALFETLVLAIIGWRAMRALLAPLLFLFFLVPFGAFLVPWLQGMTARIATYGLEILQIPAYVDGLTIEIPEGTFEIAEACAGLRFLIASVVFGCFFATMIYQSAVRRTIFIGLSAVVPIIANGMRALGIIVLGHIKGSASAALTDHVLYGWIFFSFVTLILIIIGMSFADKRPLLLEETQISRPHPHSGRRVSLVMAVGLALALLGPACLALAARNSAGSLPGTLVHIHDIGGWTYRPDIDAEWRPDVAGAQRSFLDVFRNGSGATVTQFIGIYSLRVRSSALTKIANRVVDGKTWHLIKEAQWRTPIGQTAVTINSTEIRHEGQHRLVWWFYIVDNDVTASAIGAKVLQARAILRGRASLGAFVAISTEISDTGQSGPETLGAFLSIITPTWGAVRPSLVLNHSE